MHLKSWASNLTLGVVACVAIAIVTGAHVQSQSPFLVFGSSSGSSQVIKSTSNALWVSLQSGGNIGTQLFGDGTQAAPSIAFASQSGFGFYKRGTSLMSLVQGAAGILDFDGVTNSEHLNIKASGIFGFSSGNADVAAADTGLSRGGSAIVDVGNGTAADTSGTLAYTLGVMTATAFASLGTPANGTYKYCSDCTVTTAATCPATPSSCVCAGSGTGALAVRLNGSWDCAIRQ